MAVQENKIFSIVNFKFILNNTKQILDFAANFFNFAVEYPLRLQKEKCTRKSIDNILSRRMDAI